MPRRGKRAEPGDTETRECLRSSQSTECCHRKTPSILESSIVLSVVCIVTKAFSGTSPLGRSRSPQM